MKIGILAAAIVLVTALGCRGGDAPPAAGAPAPVQVQTARVGGGGAAWSEVPGAVESAQSAKLASRVSAVVGAAFIEEGAHVRAGQLLLKLDDRDVQARLAAAEAALLAATAQRDRILALAARDAATQQEKETAESAFAAARAERDATRVRSADLEIRAPFEGWVTEKRVSVGDLAVPGQPLLAIQGTGLLRVTATVTRSQADHLTPGQTLEAILDDGVVVPTRLSILAPAGDPASLRFLVKTDLPAGSGARVGSFARLRLPRGEEDPIPRVPRSALRERGALTGVFVVEEGRARLRWISPGEEAGGQITVRSGLLAGEEIVLDPRGLQDGAPVERRP